MWGEGEGAGSHSRAHMERDGADGSLRPQRFGDTPGALRCGICARPSSTWRGGIFTPASLQPSHCGNKWRVGSAGPSLSDIRSAQLAAPNLPVGPSHRRPLEAPQRKAHLGRRHSGAQGREDQLSSRADGAGNTQTSGTPRWLSRMSSGPIATVALVLRTLQGHCCAACRIRSTSTRSPVTR